SVTSSPLLSSPAGGRMASVTAVGDDSFEQEVLQSSTPVLIDFWAPWCGPCRAIAPVVQEIAQDYAGKLKALKMNVDDNPRTPSRYGVRGIPNLIIFHGGQVKEQIVDAVPKAQLMKAIDQVVNGNAYTCCGVGLGGRGDTSTSVRRRVPADGSTVRAGGASQALRWRPHLRVPSPLEVV